ncbi:hypothetical protein C7974DRAFT_321867, partial [Boeremia exigua]|uniref:uncharacterized protein n=1 Tax=Boeremia exigua TaxID=749465 RepID=UPI001E8CB7BF
PTYPSIVTLDVAGRPFKVSADVLNAESGFFQRQLSTSFNWTPQRDGTYFLDADPELFNHLLQFMRRPSVFPLFWSKDQGFDYDLYQRLQAEAKYFQIDRLHSWIEKKAYLNAITIHTYQPRTMELKDVKHDTMSGCMSENWHYVPKVHKTYVCPRRIAVHYGNQDRCGKACRLYQGDCDTEYDEEDYLEVVSVRKEIVFDETVCQMG